MSCMSRFRYGSTSVAMFAIFTLFVGCLRAAAAGAPAPASPPVDCVNTFVGTTNGGHTFPGATLPFGMVQLSPDMPRREIGYGESYDYTGHHIDGFSMTHLSGTGCLSYGDVFFTATSGPVTIHPRQYRFAFDHKDEAASPGYYRVLEQTWGINAELTTTLRCGMARFEFPAGKQENILLPISHVMTSYSHPCHLHFINDHTLTGYVTSDIFCASGPARIYFAMQANRPSQKYGLWKAGKMLPGKTTVNQKKEKNKIGAFMSWPASPKPQTVEVRVGISYVSVNGAMKNLRAEMHSWDFDRYRDAAAKIWNRALSVIHVRGGSAAHRACFYTALYHTMIDPTVFDDVDGRYVGYDKKIHRVPVGHNHIYANFSGWDIYRSEIPLLALIAPTRTADMAQSIVEMYRQTGHIWRWPAANVPGSCMVGDPMTIWLSHVWEAGLHHFDIKTAYAGMVAMANLHHRGAFPASGGVSTDEEYDISFAALSRLALSLGHIREGDRLAEWGQQYREMFDPVDGFIVPRLPDGAWLPNFDPDRYDSVHFVEGTGWEYLWLVPQDVQGLINLLGGNVAFSDKLTAFFKGNHYDPTNEPDIQVPFLYDYVGQPWKAQHIVNYEANRTFTNTPGGLANGGNDDCGEMSSWYVLSQVGFYAVDPGVPDLEVVTPRFSRITIRLAIPYSGKKFIIDAPRAGGKNTYIQSASIDGRPLNKPWFPETAVTKGGLWKVVVGSKPNRSWATSPGDAPPSMSAERQGVIFTKNGAYAKVFRGAMLNSNMNAYFRRVPRIHKKTVTLTSGHGGEETSVWIGHRLFLGGRWKAQFQYVVQNTGGDGFYFVVQNSKDGLHLLQGDNGGDKGLIQNGKSPRGSLGIGVENDGQSALEIAYRLPKSRNSPRMPIAIGSTGAVNFNLAGAPITITISSDGGRNLEFQAMQGGKTFHATYRLPAPLTTLLQGPCGYVGFTAGTGAADEVQQIKDFSFHTQPFTSIGVNGLNQRLVVPANAALGGNGKPGFGGYVSNALDGIADFYSAGLTGAPKLTGLPADGVVGPSAANFRLQSSPSGDALFLTGDSRNSGSLKLKHPPSLNYIAFLATSANGGQAVGRVTLFLKDPSGHTIDVATDYAAPDWFFPGRGGVTPDGNSYGVAIKGVNRVDIGTGKFDQAYDGGHPSLFVTVLNLRDLTGIVGHGKKLRHGMNLSMDKVLRLKFSRPPGHCSTAVFAVSGISANTPPTIVARLGCNCPQ